MKRVATGLACVFFATASFAVCTNTLPVSQEMKDSQVVVIGTVMGGAQPVAAALDFEQWAQVLGTIAGDDTVLVICPDMRRAAEVQAKLQKMLEG